MTSTKHELSFSAKIRLRSNGKAPASWHFITVPKDISAEILEAQKHVEKKRGWGSVRVEVRIGYYSRKTSIFPDKKLGTYVLPIKKEVRTELHISVDDEVFVYLRLL